MNTCVDKIYEDALNFTKDIDGYLHTLSHVNARVSTMTVAIKLNANEINLVKVNDNWTEGLYENIEYCRNNRKNFNNSLLFWKRHVDGKGVRKAIKVFCTGVLHITGYTNLQDVLDTSEEIAALLSVLERRDQHRDRGALPVLTVTNYAVQMINVCFKLSLPSDDTCLCLVTIHERLIKECPYYVAFNTNEYAGIMIHAPDFKVLLFNSGNVIITSVNDLAGIKRAYEFCESTLCDMDASVYVDSMVKRKNMCTTGNFDYGLYLQLK